MVIVVAASCGCGADNVSNAGKAFKVSLCLGNKHSAVIMGLGGTPDCQAEDGILLPRINS